MMIDETGTHAADSEGPSLAGFDVIYVDAMNVIGSRPDGWWRDRDAAVRGLVETLGRFVRSLDGEVVVVIDGRLPEGLPADHPDELRVMPSAGRGPDAADDRIIELLGAYTSGGAKPRIGVVTADRDLRERAASRGASTIGPRRLLAALDALDVGQ